jgi:hypothetical protein
MTYYAISLPSKLYKEQEEPTHSKKQVKNIYIYNKYTNSNDMVVMVI